ncbi:MAG: hypothetical protein IPL96_17290 [Holophagaceae bacterium]|nr:hypothetical protein [Holophagaceae bacterium]
MSSKKLTLNKETLRQLDSEVHAVQGGGFVTLANTCICPIPNTTLRYSLGSCPSIACGTLTGGGTIVINPAGGSFVAH